MTKQIDITFFCSVATTIGKANCDIRVICNCFAFVNLSFNLSGL